MNHIEYLKINFSNFSSKLGQISQKSKNTISISKLKPSPLLTKTKKTQENAENRGRGRLDPPLNQQ